MRTYKIYKCNICGSIFNESEFKVVLKKGCYEEEYGVFGLFPNSHNYENTVNACPFCRQDDYDEGFVCSKCHKFVKCLLDEEKNICYDCGDNDE